MKHETCHISTLTFALLTSNPSWCRGKSEDLLHWVPICEGSSPACSAFAYTGQEMKQETRNMKPGLYILITATHETCNVKYMKHETCHISTLTFALVTSNPWWCRGKCAGPLHWLPMCEGSSPAVLLLLSLAKK